jgi:hypothetical protein
VICIGTGAPGSYPSAPLSPGSGWSSSLQVQRVKAVKWMGSKGTLPRPIDMDRSIPSTESLCPVLSAQ